MSNCLFENSVSRASNCKVIFIYIRLSFIVFLYPKLNLSYNDLFVKPQSAQESRRGAWRFEVPMLGTYARGAIVFVSDGETVRLR